MRQVANDRFFAWVESEIAKGRNVRIRMKGHSMMPLLRSGLDEVVVSPCVVEELRAMDIVLFRHRGRYILHRIIWIEGGCYRMQGDGVWRFSESCEAETIIGVVRKVYRSGRGIDTDSFLWKLVSRLWRMLGQGGRGLILKLYYRLNR